MTQRTWKTWLCGLLRHPGLRHGLTGGRSYAACPCRSKAWWTRDHA